MPESATAEAPLLHHNDDIVDGSVDYKGRTVTRSKSGAWKSMCFIIGVQFIERFAFYGIYSNLMNYLTGKLGLTTATAAANVDAWSGAGNLLPLLVAFVADSFLGCYRTIIISSVLYILGLGFLTLSAVFHFDSSGSCGAAECSPPRFQVFFVFFSLYLVAVAQAGHRPCVQAFGADQFDEHDPREGEAKSSFFNWCFFGTSSGILLSSTVMIYVQDNLGWGLGFGILCLVVCFAFGLFLSGNRIYRFRNQHLEAQSPFSRIFRVFVNAAKNRYREESVDEEIGDSHQFKFLNRALIAKDGEVCSTIDDVEDAKVVLKLAPLWGTCLIFGVIHAQPSTLFTKQVATLDRSVNSAFVIPSASLQSLINITIVVCLPLYERVLVPIARSLTGKPSGITTVQRNGVGIFFCLVSMVVSALVEAKRLETARENGLVDEPNVIVPLSLWWFIPQYLLVGAAYVFLGVGLQEFFYDQVPRELRSVGVALYLTVFGIGSILSSILISFIQNVTGGDGHDGWFSDNLNRAHLDYFYWLIAGMSGVALVAYLYFSRSYVYNHRTCKT